MIETIDRSTVMQLLPEQVHLEKNAVELQELGLDPRILAAKYTEVS